MDSLPSSPSLKLLQKQSPSQKQQQRLMMSPQMQQAIHLLQLPFLELALLLQTEFEQNPVIECITEEERSDDPELESLELATHEETEEKEANQEKELSFDDRDFEVLKQLDEEFRNALDQEPIFRKRSPDEEKMKAFLENSITSQDSLFEHLMKESRETFRDPEELKIAEIIIGHMDENGFLQGSLEAIRSLYGFDEEKLKEILRVVQTFEPFGIGAKDLKESLLIQLRCQNKNNTLPYQIVSEHYEDLLHNRLPMIRKQLGCTLQEVEEAISRHIAKLDLHPGMSYDKQPVSYIIPDARIKLEADQLEIEINEDFIPPLRLNRRYMRMLEDETLSKETKDFIKQKIVSAKWLLKNIHQRNETLFKILQAVVKRQKDFFLKPEGQLVPMAMNALLDELDMHESTITRTVANKYVDTPRGLLPLKSFFTHAYEAEDGEEISSKTVREAVKAIIDQEDKAKPYSDEKISQLLKEQGILCARRTIAKYRIELNLGNAQQRRKWGT